MRRQRIPKRRLESVRSRRVSVEQLESRQMLAGDTSPFQNPNNRFDVNGDGGLSGTDFLALVSELGNRNISNPDGTLPDPPPAEIFLFPDVNGDCLVTDDDLGDFAAEFGLLDFGDAPSAAQSGFANSYPTTLADDGARHLQDAVILGSQFNSESDGVPSTNADSETDSDGLAVNGPIRVGESVELTVTVQGSGVLDAWIDYNRDGIWDNTTERVAAGVAVSNGANALTLNIPANASVGTTYMRLRVSSGGVDGPTGFTRSGEVDDFQLTIEPGTGGGDTINVNTSVLVRRDGANVVVTEGSTELLNTPVAGLDDIQLLGNTADNSVTVDFLTGDPVPDGGLEFDGGMGTDSLLIVGASEYDATIAGFIDVSNIESLDLRDSAAQTIHLDAATIRASTSNATLSYFAGGEDDLIIKDASQWRMDTPIFNGVFALTATHQTTGERITAIVPRPYHNFLTAGDANNDGDVSALDAIQIINELGTGRVSTPGGGMAKDPTTLSEFPDFYPDHNADNNITALDALRVINELARQAPLFAPQGEWIGSLIVSDDSSNENRERDMGDVLNWKETHAARVDAALTPSTRPLVEAANGQTALENEGSADKSDDIESIEPTLAVEFHSPRV